MSPHTVTAKNHLLKFVAQLYRTGHAPLSDEGDWAVLDVCFTQVVEAYAFLRRTRTVNHSG